MKIQTILDQIDLQSMALPEFQRGYVWNREQVRGLMYSLYRKHPVGSLLVWVTKAETAPARGGVLTQGSVELLLDGQQRITSLYGIVRGKPPRFFDGNAWAFTGLYFHLEDQAFEFHAPLKMKGNPLWINVTELMQQGVGKFIQRLLTIPDVQEHLNTYINRLTAVHSIQDIPLHIERVTGEDKTIDDVVDIFNRVNSGGTKLSKGDLALARVCAGWPEARQEMKVTLTRWQNAGFGFTLDWLLRNITTILCGESMFAALENVTTFQFQDGLKGAEQTCNYLLNTVSGRLGLDHDRVLGGRYAFPVMSRYVELRGGKLQDTRERDKLLYWYVHSFLWGRFTGSTESVMNQDLRVLDGTEQSLDRLIDNLRLTRGDLRIRPEDFGGTSLGARFYPLLYLLTRVYGARDWGNGLPLSANLLGKLNALQVHHIFPKAILYKHGYGRGEVNAIANFCFLTQDANLDISAADPAVYFEAVENNHPGALASQWIPLNRQLWRVEKYRDFLAARRVMLAEAANRFLSELLGGHLAVTTSVPQSMTVVADPDEDTLRDLVGWCEARSIPQPQLHHEVSDTATGAVLAAVDAAWPQGVQEEYSEPVAFLLEPDEAMEQQLNAIGYRYFTDLDALHQYLGTFDDTNVEATMASVS